MKRFHIVTALVVLMLMLTMMVNAQRDDGNGNHSWQYATIHVEPFGTWFWTEPALHAEGKDLNELCRELSIVNTLNDNPSLSVIVSWAGTNGWEMVSMQQKPGTVVGWFKRRQYIDD